MPDVHEPFESGADELDWPEPEDPEFDEAPTGVTRRTRKKQREQQAQHAARAVGGLFFAGKADPVTPTGGRIVVDLAPIMQKRGLVVTHGPLAHRGRPNLGQFQRLTGMGYQTCWTWVRNPDHMTRFEFHSLAVICEALRCQPSDFIFFRPGLGRRRRPRGGIL